MRISRLVFSVFLLLGLLFTVGSFFEIEVLYYVANIAIVPTLLLYYFLKAQKMFWPLIVILLLFYVRDLLMMAGFSRYPIAIMTTFGVGMIFLYLCAITDFRKSGLHRLELISLAIMYGFLAFLTYSMSEMVAEVIPNYSEATYLYLILLSLLVAVTFTSYLLKSNWASLSLMMAAASLEVSEISLFFKLYILEDISVNLFFPAFHVFMFYWLVKYGLIRWQTGKLLYF